MTEIKEISWEQIQEVWATKLWPSRESAIEPVSAMRYMGGYTSDLGAPTFLGLFVDDVLVGVNSFHRVERAYRSRGLWIDEQMRSRGYGILLLKETIARVDRCIWSFPRSSSVSTYVKAGFVITSEEIGNPDIGATNYYALCEDKKPSGCNCT